MVAFRNTTRGESITDWWDNGADAIAFGRGSKGFVAINHESSSLSRTYQTSLAAGAYCNVQSNTTVTVDNSGQFTAALGANTALAIYVGKSSC
jgi:alpha-amylase